MKTKRDVKYKPGTLTHIYLTLHVHEFKIRNYEPTLVTSSESLMSSISHPHRRTERTLSLSLNDRDTLNQFSKYLMSPVIAHSHEFEKTKLFLRNERSYSMGGGEQLYLLAFLGKENNIC